MAEQSSEQQWKIEKRIAVPEGVEVSVADRAVRVKGPNGELEKDFSDPRYHDTVFIEKSGNEIIVRAVSDTKKVRSLCGTIAAHVRNMMLGVTAGYKYVMKIFYTHFPISITVKDGDVQIRNFVGEKGARIARIAGNAQVQIEKEEVIITGANVEAVGQTAANIERACRISKRDRRVFQDGIYLSARQLQTGEKL